MRDPVADVVALSRLLDRAMNLDATRLEALLRALPSDLRHLEPAVRSTLRERDAACGLLAALPTLTAARAREGDVPRPRDLVGAYRLIHEIGQGGMGVVWLAERADGAFERRVALKLPRSAWSPVLEKRMARERDIVAMLRHPQIQRLCDYGVDDKGRPFLTLEYVDGVPIDRWCDERNVPLHDRLRLVVQVARAAAYAHTRLVVHRDIKPSNVLVSSDGRVHLLDFGIAARLDQASPQATWEELRPLTPRYASPEQIKGEVVTIRSDVYSLGVLAYELVTGIAPHEAPRRSLGAIEEAILGGDALPPSTRAWDKATARQIRGDVDAIVGKAMMVVPAMRYATADALADDIERHLRGEPVDARPDGAVSRLRKKLARHPVAFAAGAAVALGGAGVAATQSQKATCTEEPASGDS